MKKVLSVILAAVLLFGSSILVLAAPTLSGMEQTISFSNWYGFGVKQTLNSNGIVTSYSSISCTYNQSNSTKQVVCLGNGSSGQQLATVFYNGYNLIPEYTSGQTFNISVRMGFANAGNTADSAYLLVCDSQFLTYFTKESLQHVSINMWLQQLDELREQGQLDHSVVMGSWWAWKKISIQPSGGGYYDIDFTVPQNSTELYFCVVTGKTQPGNSMITFYNATLSPVGETFGLWQGILADQREQQFQEDVIGSDAGNDDEGSGLLGIIKFIKNLPQWIADKFIGLFVPEDGYLESAFDQLSDTLSEHFGIIWQAGDIIVQIVTKISQFSPGTSSDPMDYDLKFPAAEVQIDVKDDGSVDWNSGEGSLFPLIPDEGDGYYHVDLSFFADGPGATIYSLYRAFVTVTLILGFIWLSHRKFKELFAGGDDG